MESLSIGLDAWIIQDGNYSDFSVGQTTEFALEFYSEDGLSVSEPATPELSWEGDSIYNAIGKVVHSESDWWVADFGILMFREESPPEEARLGNWLRGRISVGVDPFFYFERLGQLRGAPALIYDWTIDRIEIETAPFVEVAPKMLARDSSRRARKSILQTDAWADDGGSADYLLRCRRLERPARRTLGLK